MKVYFICGAHHEKRKKKLPLIPNLLYYDPQANKRVDQTRIFRLFLLADCLEVKKKKVIYLPVTLEVDVRAQVSQYFDI